jgi:hypothetical protein
VVKESTEEIAGREAASALKERGKHHNLIRIGCWIVFPGGRTSLQHSMVREEVVRDNLANLAFIHDG